ncbi:hypothetical protein ON05_034255 (plasmid) [Acaryochloris sp. CCMEE 5410]|nr:hypothetical protein ON05_034255 [Acaryochloris sp. CCMEE 5410]
MEGSSWQAQRSDVQIQHHPGEMGQSDFTQLKGFSVTVQGEAFHHILYHYRLSYSGWQYVQVIQGERVLSAYLKDYKCLICLWWCA